MELYSSIHRWYDEIFPVDPGTVRFLAGLAGPGEAVLDLACGTGGHALELARLGHPVTGLDLDGGMIARAREKAAAQAGGAPARFLAGDMREVERLCPGPYGLVFCVGNSLVHLADEGEVGRFLESCRRVLRPGGRLAVQILHYDRILRLRVTELPELRSASGAVRFTRRYERGPAPQPGRGAERLWFITELAVREGEEVRRVPGRVPLLALPAATLGALAEGAGFRDVRLFGDFQGGALAADSFLTVLTARA